MTMASPWQERLKLLKGIKVMFQIVFLVSVIKGGGDSGQESVAQWQAPRRKSYMALPLQPLTLRAESTV